MKTLERLTNAFPVWVLAGTVLALWQPGLFTWFSGPLITLGLGIIMLGMGLTLTVEDFRGVLKFPFNVFLGMLLQYTIMPAMGWLMATAFRLPAPLAAGVILVGCCPGGTASNVVNYLAKADVPLSVTMTAISTLLAVILTPLLTTWLVGSRVEVSGWGLLVTTFEVIVLPIVLGVSMNRFMPKVTAKLVPFAPLAAVIFITMIVASIVGGGRDMILKSGLQLLGAVFGLHAGGYLFGYLFAVWILKKEIPARTISVEVGMQNSGLGVVLARKNFSDPAVAIPCAISSVFHSLMGSLLAAFWRRSAGRYTNE